ncbi:S-layer homology domain-containing protein [Paenibacillus validus]|uniref:S-layer homology domain-containing protein n=1 Tax=Paenibacillus validus TaxID=44253 RepID=A0A7X2ZEH8_9BACL|nr:MULTISPECIES: S-layer homology domain-containing protein [Paenibacillus]MED4602630.1 S-layer homology domain-containing protein [Paenibacillus validus]MED4604906.1 S-layer homology domain-containing protein [Paenibacillus validus]MUG73453.1 S-layer homology domain-containing protein [Paenibacillus validus]
MNNTFKKTLVSGLTLAMVLGSSTAAFAHGNDKDRDKDRKDNDRNERSSIQTKYTPKSANLEIKLTFDDLRGKDVEWAARYIASLASKKVFEGYEDGTFQPRKTISRIEAITAAVRLMGLRDQAESPEAKQANLNFSDAKKVQEKYPWAVGYVSVALQNDLFTETDTMVQPEKEADRLWATTLLVKALKLQDEAKAKMNAKLPFKDSNKIPAGSVGYIAVALEKNLIDGYEDNTFRPNQPVTRAELAALLDRTGSQLPDHTSVKGSVVAPVANNILQVKASNNETVSVELDANAFVFRNGARVAWSELRANDQVLIRTYGGKAIYVEVLKLAEGNPQQTVDFSVTGTLNGYTLNSQGSIATISINQNVNGSVQTAVYGVSPDVYISGDVSLLTSGRSVELRGKQQLVHTVIIR